VLPRALRGQRQPVVRPLFPHGGEYPRHLRYHQAIHRHPRTTLRIHSTFLTAPDSHKIFPNGQQMESPRRTGLDAEDANRPKPHQQEYERAMEEWSLVLQGSLDHDDERNVCIAANVKTFLAFKEGQVRTGELTAGRYTPIKLHLHDFQDWLGPTSDVSVISGKVLSAYHADLV
jgi:hypothetical protein